MWTELELKADQPPLVQWDYDRGDLERFTQYPSIGIVFSADGRIKAPKDPVLQKRALRLMLAWQMHARGDDSLLIEMGIFPKKNN